VAGLVCARDRPSRRSSGGEKRRYSGASPTSLLEGINNKIKVIKRIAYGCRDDDFFFNTRAAFPGRPG